MAINQITIHGRLIATPELKTTPNGVEYCGITVAVNRNYKEADGTYGADFFNVDTWRATAKTVANYFTKGSEIIVTGAMRCDKFTDKDGNPRNAWKLQAQSIDFCGAKQQKEQSAQQQNNAQGHFVSVEPDDDVPF